jgi:hypothetical protein
MTWEDVRRLGLALPETEEALSWGTPALKVRGKLLARLRDEGETLVVRVDFEERLALTHAQPETYYVTPHYEEYPYVLVRLANADPEELHELLVEAWLEQAPKRLAASFDRYPGRTSGDSR